MNILIIHNFYSTTGGEDLVVNNEYNSLKKQNNNVYFYTRHSTEIKSIFVLFFSYFFSIKTFFDVRKIIKEKKIEIIHLHNIFPLISPSIYLLIKLYKIKAVQTIHNFKLFCLNGLFLRNGKICTKCLGRLPISGVKYKCYRNSYFYSFAIFIQSIIYSFYSPNKLPITKFLIFNNYFKKIFISAGVNESKLEIKNNFIPIKPHSDLPKKKKSFDFLFVGRLSSEKGINFLLDCFSNHLKQYKLVIIGDSVNSFDLIRYQSNSIKFLGRLSNEKVISHMKKSKALIFPSIWFEGLPLVIIEAFSQGLPVILPNYEPLLEMFSRYDTCFFYKSNNKSDFIKVINECSTNQKEREKKSRNALKTFNSFFSERSNIENLNKIYNSII